ncbi:MAG: PASTA domain-containing protein [Elusimicrobia bacterium]|nr:PASTA domain-containing protein [Elusimicrobiota bacterium]
MNEMLVKYYKSGSDFVHLKFIIKLSLVLLTLFFLTYFFFYIAMESVIHHRAEVIVPDIKGKSSLAALRLISENNLALKIKGFEFNEAVPIGTVLRQAPEAGMTVRENKIVRVIFSQGGESVFTPNLVGLPLRNAELLLRQRMLVLGEVSEAYSLKAEKGTVLSQDPNQETSVSKNDMVQIVVSAGVPPSGIILMPDFKQKKVDEAYKWALDNNFTVIVTEDIASLFPNGTVLEQNPSSDIIVNDKTQITLTVSSRKIAANPDDEYLIHYEISQSGSQRHIRIVAIGHEGDKEVFNGLRDPGTKIDLIVPHEGIEKVRIFVNGIMVEERRLNAKAE